MHDHTELDAKLQLIPKISELRNVEFTENKITKKTTVTRKL